MSDNNNDDDNIEDKTAKQQLSILSTEFGTSAIFPSLKPQHKSQNLFTECVNFWGASLMAPTTTNLRIMARKGLLGSEEDARLVLTLPVTIKTLMDVFQRNQDAMLKEFTNDPGIPFHIEAVKLYQEQFPSPQSAQLVVFEDEKNQEELVYGIIVNTFTKTTFLIFRGSVTKRDYEADMDVKMRTFHFGGHKVRAQKGFSDYLFGTKEEIAVKSRDGLPHTKFERIQQSLLRQYQKYPDHELCITGHSLGGALAILATAALAMEKDMKPMLEQCGPIRTVTFGSLLVGDLKLLRCFQQLEQTNLVRSTVIMNEGDLIPLLPFASGWRLYRAVGKRIIISNGRKHKPIIYSPPEQLLCCKRCRCDWVSVPGFIFPRFCFVLCCRRRFWENHTVETTTRNIFGSREYLEALSVQGLYERKRLLPFTIHW